MINKMATTQKLWPKLAAAALSLFVAGVSAQSWQQQGYDAQAERIGARVKANELNVYEANRQMIAVAKSYFPNDPLLIGIWEDLTALAKSHVSGELPKDRFNELVNMRWEIFDAANRARHEAAAQQQAEERRSAFMQNFLTGMARSMERNNPKPIECTSTLARPHLPGLRQQLPGRPDRAHPRAAGGLPAGVVRAAWPHEGVAPRARRHRARHRARRRTRSAPRDGGAHHRGRHRAGRADAAHALSDSDAARAGLHSFNFLSCPASA
jgi:hypothetical protein